MRLVLLFALLAPAAYSLELTPEGQAYLDSRGRVVRFAVRPNYIPYEYEDLRDVATGIVPEFIREVARRAGLEADGKERLWFVLDQMRSANRP